MPNSIFANAKASALETKLLGSERLSRMIDCARPSDALKVLQETGFGEGLSVPPSEAEKLIEAEERAYTAFVRETSPSEKLTRFLLARYDYHNAEAVMRAKYLKRDAKSMTGAEGAFPLALMEEKIFADDYGAFGAELSAALAAADELFVGGAATGRQINTLFSRAKFRDLSALAHGDKALSEIAALRADAANIGIALRTRSAARAAEMTVAGGVLTAEEIAYLAEESAENIREKFRYSPRKEMISAALEDFAAGQPLTSLERIADGAAVTVLARDRYTDEGNRPFMRYCFKKTAEIANVRIVMSCLNNGAEKAVIRARVRETL